MFAILSSSFCSPTSGAEGPGTDMAKKCVHVCCLRLRVARQPAPAQPCPGPTVSESTAHTNTQGHAAWLDGTGYSGPTWLHYQTLGRLHRRGCHHRRCAEHGKRNRGLRQHPPQSRQPAFLRVGTQLAVDGERDLPFADEASSSLSLAGFACTMHQCSERDESINHQQGRGSGCHELCFESY